MTLTNLGLVKFANDMLAKGDETLYVYGTFGQTLTQTLINYKVKQYSYNVSRKTLYTNIMNSSGTEYAFDCVGLIKAYLWGWNNGRTNYVADQDKSANGMYNASKVKGNIASIPETPGVLVHMDGHIGVYVGNGYVIECTPTKTFAKQSHGAGGVCKTRLNARKWEHWLECPFISYESVKVLKSVEDIAKEVIDGKWGVGEARKKSLTKAGYDYAKVQAKVNEVLKKSNTSKTITLGSKVRVSDDAVIGGLASNRGKKVSNTIKSKTWTVSYIETHKNVKEALLKGANTWVAVKYLTVI